MILKNGAIFPIQDADTTLRRLRDLHCYHIDGSAFYRLRDVMDAMGVPEKRSVRDNVSQRIRKEHKRYLWEKKRTKSGKVYSDRRLCYIDLSGVECIILRYGGRTPRAVLINALPK